MLDSDAIRAIIERVQPDLQADFHGRPLAEVLLEPTRIYAKPLLALMQQIKVKGLAHITGGGLVENVLRQAKKARKGAWVLASRVFPSPIMAQYDLSETERFHHPGYGHDCRPSVPFDRQHA